MAPFCAFWGHSGERRCVGGDDLAMLGRRGVTRALGGLVAGGAAPGDRLAGVGRIFGWDFWAGFSGPSEG